MSTRKSVLITGTSSGIGRAAVHHFSNLGWTDAATLPAPEQEKELWQRPGDKVYQGDHDALA